MLVARKGTTVERFPALERVGTYISSVARYGIRYLNPAGIVRSYDAARPRHLW